MNMDCSLEQAAAAVAVGATGLYFLRRYFKGGVCHSQARLDGKTVVITGCNVGIGKATALDLSRRGARIVMACRNLETTQQVAKEIGAETGGQFAFYKLDLTSLKSVRACAKEINEKEKRIDILINNAGIMMCEQSKTEDGFEMQIGTNHFGHFLFTNLLLDKIKASAPSRIINLSSVAHEHANSKTLDLDDLHFERRPYGRLRAYAQSKLANVMFNTELARRLRGTGVTTYSVHPGGVQTELSRHLMGPWVGAVAHTAAGFFMKQPMDGAQTSIYCAVEESLAKESGKYYADCREKEPHKLAKDEDLVKKFWEISAKSVGI